eukprot:tig00020684_g12913.t1
MAQSTIPGGPLSPMAMRAYYPEIGRDAEPRGLNGPLFTRSRCGGSNRNGIIFRSVEAVRPQTEPGRPVAQSWDGSDETIYGLIPTAVQVPVPDPRYRSRHSPTSAPSASTFGMHTTTRTTVTNLSGDPSPFRSRGIGHHQFDAATATFGRAGPLSASPTEFLTKTNRSLPPASRFEYPDSTARRSPVPSRAEKPIMGLKSGRNFITTNIVENILSVPKRPTSRIRSRIDYLRKADYGRVPSYLQHVKETLASEAGYVRAVEEYRRAEAEGAGRVAPLPGKEKAAMLEGLKKKWDELNKEYQMLTLSLSSLDTIGKVNRKEQYERQLAQIQADIAKLAKQHVFVDAAAGA